jgi:hypothetical protein
LCFFYAKALLTMPTAAVTGRKLLVKSISYTPSTIYRLAFLGYYFLFRQLKRMA